MKLKAKSTMLLAIPDEHLLKFHGIKDAKTLWEAIKTMFGGNKESKKMQKTIEHTNMRILLHQDLKFTMDKLFFINLVDDVMFSFFANQFNSPQLDNEDLEQIDTGDLEEMNLKWQVAMLTMRVKRFINKTGRNMKFNGKETVGFDKTKVECYNCHKRGHFARECRAPRNQGNRNGDNTRRVVSVETPANALVVTDGMGYCWSYQAEEGPTNFSLMDHSSSGSSCSSSSDIETGVGFNNQMNENELLDMHMNESEVFKSASDSSVNESKEDNNQVNDRYKAGKGYHVVPPPYTGNFMPPRPDLSFAGLDDSIFKSVVNETVTRSGLEWLFDIDSLTKSMNYEPVTTGNQTNDACIETNVNAGQAGQEKESNNEIHYCSILLLNSHSLFKTDSSTQDINNAGPKTSIFDRAYDDEDMGAEADLNNLETTMNMDVKSAFLYGTIKEEVYVCQPPGFEDPQFSNKVFKVEKALYGLHQATRARYKTLSTYLIENGFRRGTINKTLFINKDKGDILLVQVYVDDIMFGSTKKSLCDEFKGLMHKRFRMSSMGELTFFLSTPMEPNKALIKDEEADSVDVHLYISMIGSLMYLTAFKPDIMFAVCACARDLPFNLEAFSDSDYARASLDRKSTTGGCQFLGKRLIYSWQCQKQTIELQNSNLQNQSTDKTKITRKPSKMGKHGHEKRKSTREVKDSKRKPRKEVIALVYQITGLPTQATCELPSDLTANNDLPIIEELYGQDQKERGKQVRA
ncbi:ribonuclease H-like domain-containing protein [Tanacetum coccineum]